MQAGVPAVVAVRGYLPEARVSIFAHAFYRRIFAGAPPRDAFAAAEAHTDKEDFSTTTGSYVLLEPAPAPEPDPEPDPAPDPEPSPSPSPYPCPYP